MMKSTLSTTVAGLTAVLLAVTVTATTASAHELKSTGSPSNMDSDHNGYFVWNDGHDVHLETSSSDSSTTYRGTLHTDGKFKDLSRDGDNEHVSISDDGHTLRFRGSPNNTTDGFKVRVENADKVDLNLRRNNDSAPTDRIWVGSDNDHPSDNNFTLHL